MRQPIRSVLLAGAWLCAALPALAHDVQAVITDGPLRQVTLTYGDGEPFAYEAYELRAQDAPLSDAPVQSGRTSEAGVIVIGPRPAGAPALRLRAFSFDGHGVDMTLPASVPTGLAAAVPLTPAATLPERIVRGAAGLAVIGALYAGWWIARRRRRTRAAATPG